MNEPGADEVRLQENTAATRWQKIKAILADALELESPSDRSALLDRACAGDETLRGEVEKLLQQETEEFEACAEHVRRDPSAGAPSYSAGIRLGSYELVRELGRGGMGTVWLAQRADRQFEQQVAIKFLKRGTDTDEVLRRFRAERRILARLNHPNIARLFDAGTTADGLPYFIMEYIAGTRVTDFVRERDLPVKERVRLFVKICAAVQFAHQSLVVHRDLKPPNILVTADGEPKLLDFGIAKLLGNGDEAWEIMTAAGRERLTPAYASPEQVRGEPITMVSDVYALGALLYEMLCGLPPHRLPTLRPSSAELLRVVCEEQPVRPSLTSAPPELRRQLRGDLDNIILRALSKAPERRYASAGNLGEDLRRYLDGRPVRARPDTIGYRARKFISRNRIASAAVFLISATLLIAVVVTTYEATVARRERAQAERRFHELRRLANSFLFELNDAIETRPTAARKILVQRACEYLDSLAGDAAKDQSLQRELATAYQKLGDVESQLNQANVGDTAGALASYRKALALREALFTANQQAKDDVQLRCDLALSYRRLGDILAKTGDTAAALASYRKTLPLLEKADRSVSDRAIRVALASDYEIVGRTLFRTGDFPGAITHYQKALAEIEPLTHEASADPAPQLEQSKTLTSLAYLLAESGKKQESLRYYRENLGIIETLAADHAENPELQRRLMEAHEWVGTALRDCGDSLGALAELGQAEKLSQAALRADSANVQTRNDLADVLHNTGSARYQQGDAAGALKDFREAKEYYQSVVDADTLNVHAQRQTLVAEEEIGQALALNGDLANASATLRESLAGFHALAARDKANREFQSDEARGEAALGEVLAKVGREAEAAEHLRKASNLLKELLALSPQDQTIRGELAGVEHAMVELCPRKS